MELLNHITNLIGLLKDKNIDIKSILHHQEYIEIRAKLDYQSNPCPHCQGQIIKYDFQKPSTIPLLDTQGMPTVLKLKKRRFQCKECRRVIFLSSRNFFHLLRLLLIDSPSFSNFKAQAKTVDWTVLLQHLGRAMMSTRIAIMKEFDKASLPYRALKNHWKPRFLILRLGLK